MTRARSYDETLADHVGGDQPPVALTYPLGDYAPGTGEVHQLAEGIGWARIPMPGSLGHINSWLLDDGDALVAVDTGLQLKMCSDAWKSLFAGDLKHKRLSHVLCTHLHPDHIGLAGWLAKKFDADIWMTRGEWLTARMIIADARAEPPAEVEIEQRAAGWSEEEMAAARSQGWDRFARMVYPLPVSYHRLRHDDVLDLGAQRWRVVVGSGHSPEHACLLNETTGVLVSGDQVLPRISSNVSVNISEPDGDPLGEWLDSIDRLLELPAGLLVCPAHGSPFHGLHPRLIALRDEHHARLDAICELLREAPRRAVDCFGVLFNRVIGEEHRSLASGEATAHLHRLLADGRARRDVRDGVHWYSPA